MLKVNKSVLIGAAMGALSLFVLYILLVFVWGEKPENGSKEPIVSQYKAQDVLALEVLGVQGGYTLKNSGEAGFTLLDAQRVPTDRTKLLGAVTALAGVEGTVVDEHPTTLEKYGLAVPTFIINAAFVDGFTVSLHASRNVDGIVYWKEHDKETIYSSPSSQFEPFMGSSEQFISHSIAPEMQRDKLQELKLSFEGQKLEFKAINGKITQTKPTATYADSELVGKIIDKLLIMQASDDVIIHPTPEQMKQYCMDNPEVELEAVWQGADKVPKSATYRCGITLDGKAYVMRDNVPVIYAVNAQGCPWNGITAADFAPKRLPKHSAAELEVVQISTDKALFEFKIEYENTAEQAGTKNMKITLGGNEIDPTAFDAFLQTVGRISCKTKVDDPKTGHDAMLVFHYRDKERQPQAVTFYGVQSMSEPERATLSENAAPSQNGQSEASGETGNLAKGEVAGKSTQESTVAKGCIVKLGESFYEVDDESASYIFEFVKAISDTKSARKAKR